MLSKTKQPQHRGWEGPLSPQNGSLKNTLEYFIWVTGRDHYDVYTLGLDRDLSLHLKFTLNKLRNWILLEREPHGRKSKRPHLYIQCQLCHQSLRKNRWFWRHLSILEPHKRTVASRKVTVTYFITLMSFFFREDQRGNIPMAMVLTIRQSPITWVSLEADAEMQD